MTGFSPFTDVEEDLVRVHLLESDPATTVELECVLDLTDFGEAVGLEVLDLAKQLNGGRIDPVRITGRISWSYDVEIDALYVHLADGRAQIQKSVVARAELDNAGRIVQLTVLL
jgi:hypothetical protein